MQSRPPSVLLIEDHADIAESVMDYLEHSEFTVDWAPDGVTGLHLAVTNEYDVIALDLMLPGMDGIDLCKRLRRDARRDIPVLMLTARDTLNDKVDGFDAGADDYLVKPFELQELKARLIALTRRQRGEVTDTILRVSDLSFDMTTLTIERAGKQISLTPIAQQILAILMRASPAVVSRRELERQIWGDVVPDSDALRSHLYTLRKAVDKPFDRALIQTVFAGGYRIAVPEAGEEAEASDDPT